MCVGTNFAKAQKRKGKRKGVLFVLLRVHDEARVK
jgi:hypothetical protein